MDSEGSSRDRVVARALSRGTLSELRGIAIRAARGIGLAGERVDQFAVAVDEAMANAIRHAGGGTVSITVTPGLGLTCEVHDHGPGIPAGAWTVMPPPGAVSGRGLPLMYLLCDVVRIRTGPDGTTVLLTMRLAGRPD
jgi:serine/threonine-protein kinase RsbW